jgi:hypothetical protein
VHDRFCTRPRGAVALAVLHIFGLSKSGALKAAKSEGAALSPRDGTGILPNHTGGSKRQAHSSRSVIEDGPDRSGVRRFKGPNNGSPPAAFLSDQSARVSCWRPKAQNFPGRSASDLHSPRLYAKTARDILCVPSIVNDVERPPLARRKFIALGFQHGYEGQSHTARTPASLFYTSPADRTHPRQTCAGDFAFWPAA